MAIWTWIVGQIPGVDFRAFIDDTYLWTREANIDNLGGGRQGDGIVGYSLWPVPQCREM